MLLATDVQLFTLLGTPPLYKPSPLDHTAAPTTAVQVVRYGSSEYTALLQNPEKPFISLQYMGCDHEDPPMPLGFGVKMLRDAGDDGWREVKYPQPRRLNYQIDIRSPHELWLRQIEVNLDRIFNFPVYRTTLTAEPWGAGNGTATVPLLYFFSNPQRMPDTQDPKQNRFFRLLWRVEVWSWLLAPTSEAVLLSKYHTAEVTVRDMTTEDVLDVITLVQED